MTPLMAAAESHDNDALKLLINASKADVNKQNFLGETALHFAAREGNLEGVKLLLEADANQELLDYDFYNAADCARDNEIDRLIRDWDKEHCQRADLK
jgi:uncharacterized protein